MYSSSQGDDTKKMITGILAGVIFGIAWWIVIDAGVIANHNNYTRLYKFEHFLCGIFASFGLLMVNSFKWEDYKGEGFSENNHKRAKFCLLFGCLIIFIAILGAIWVATDRWLAFDGADSKWPGVAILLNPMLILISAGVLRAGRIS